MHAKTHLLSQCCEVVVAHAAALPLVAPSRHSSGPLLYDHALPEV